MVELGEGNSPLLLKCRSNLKIAEILVYSDTGGGAEQEALLYWP